MWRRSAMTGAALLFVGLGIGTGPADAAVAAKTWCMTYCDTVHLGCRKTVGWFDMEACDRWLEGCLDGCRVND